MPCSNCCYSHTPVARLRPRTAQARASAFSPRRAATTGAIAAEPTMYSMRFLLDQRKRLGKLESGPSNPRLGEPQALTPVATSPRLPHSNHTRSTRCRAANWGSAPGARRDMHQARSVPASTSRLGGDTASVPHSPCPLWPLYYPDHSSQPPLVQLDFRYPD